MGRSAKLLDEQKAIVVSQAQEILRLTHALIEAQERYNALDQGMEELKDGYEQMALDWRDELVKKDQRIQYLEGELLVHHESCLMSLTLDDKNYMPLDEDTHTHERHSHAEPEREDHPRTDRHH
jgi:hypothetical protein